MHRRVDGVLEYYFSTEPLVMWVQPPSVQASGPDQPPQYQYDRLLVVSQSLVWRNA